MGSLSTKSESKTSFTVADVVLMMGALGWIFDRYLNAYHLNVLVRIGINIILAVSLNLINGFTGLFSIGGGFSSQDGVLGTVDLSQRNFLGKGWEVFLRLRILEGVPSSWVEPERVAPFLESGLLLDHAGSLIPTERGMLVLNELVLALTG